MEIMKVAIIGLGKMGLGIAKRILQADYCVFGHDPNIHAQKEAQDLGIQIYDSLPAMAIEADVIWFMVPQGPLIDTLLAQIDEQLHSKKPIVVDGGNSFFQDSMRRAQMLARNDIHYLDCGVSGGVHGEKNGFCLMVGGDFESYKKIEPILKAVAAPAGYNYIGLSGTGHYVKMVHNGIEYGILQAYAEGFHLLREGDFKDLDLEKISDLWMNASVIRSWLLELAHGIFVQDQELASIDGKIQEGGTGAWTVDNAHKNKIPIPVIESSLLVRRESQKTGGNFATKLIQMLRNAFGGHPVTIKKETRLS